MIKMNVIDRITSGSEKSTPDNSKDAIALRLLGRSIKKTEEPKSGNKKIKREALLARRREQARKKTLKDSKEAQNYQKQGVISKSLAMLGFGNVTRNIFGTSVEADNNQKKNKKTSEGNLSPKALERKRKKQEEKRNQVARDIKKVRKALPKVKEGGSHSFKERFENHYNIFLEPSENKLDNKKLKSVKAVLSSTWSGKEDIFTKLFYTIRNLFEYNFLKKNIKSVNYFLGDVRKKKNKIKGKVDTVKKVGKGAKKAGEENRAGKKNLAPLMMFMGHVTGRMRSAVFNMPKKLLGKKTQKTWLQHKLKMTPKEVKKFKEFYKNTSDKAEFRKMLERRGFAMKYLKGSYVLNITTRAIDYYWRPKNRTNDHILKELAEGLPVWGTMKAYDRIGLDNGDSRLYQQSSFALMLGLDIASAVALVLTLGAGAPLILAARYGAVMLAKPLIVGLTKIGLKKSGEKILLKSSRALKNISQKKALLKSQPKISTVQKIKNIPKNMWAGFKDSTMWKMVAGYTALSVGLSEVLGSETIQNFTLGEVESLAGESIDEASKNMTAGERELASMVAEEVSTQI